MNSSGSWNLRIDSDVLKALQRIPRRDAGVLLEAIRLLPANPYFGDLQKMSGDDHVWRRRIGSYRIFYKLMAAGRIILVFRLERRTSKTY
ncbi:MAG: type II toxin-antitoxin system RelE/ParE family toxin [Patescibacteria group bacterium]